jgi:O-antigen ligase
MILMVGAGMTYKAWDSLSSRYEGFDFSHEYESEQGDRGSYFRKGWPALQDNPVFGVGLNNWSYWISNRYSNEAGYYSHDTYPSVDSAPYSNRQEAPAHNLYLLTAVELGWIGLLFLIALFGRWLFISGSGWMKSDGNFLDRVRLGAFLSLCGVLMQSMTEWEFRQTSLFFMGHITMGVAAFIYHQSKGSSQN